MHLLTLMFNKVNVMFNLLSKAPSFRRENETLGPNPGSSVRDCENGALSVVAGKATVAHERCILCGYCAPHGQRLAIRMV
jgi:hypothetical protein